MTITWAHTRSVIESILKKIYCTCSEYNLTWPLTSKSTQKDFSIKFNRVICTQETEYWPELELYTITCYTHVTRVVMRWAFESDHTVVKSATSATPIWFTVIRKPRACGRAVHYSLFIIMHIRAPTTLTTHAKATVRQREKRGDTNT